MRRTPKLTVSLGSGAVLGAGTFEVEDFLGKKQGRGVLDREIQLLDAEKARLPENQQPGVRTVQAGRASVLVRVRLGGVGIEA